MVDLVPVHQRQHGGRGGVFVERQGFTPGQVGQCAVGRHFTQHGAAQIAVGNSTDEPALCIDGQQNALGGVVYYREGLLPWQGQGHAKCVEGVGIHGGSTDVSKC